MVDIANDSVDKVLEHMANCTIRGFEVNVKIDGGAPVRKTVKKNNEGSYKPKKMSEDSYKSRKTTEHARRNSSKSKNEKPRRKTRYDD